MDLVQGGLDCDLRIRWLFTGGGNGDVVGEEIDFGQRG
jgi:hypothetical protein